MIKYSDRILLKMDFCKRYKFLRILPTRRVVWSWKTENGTSIRFTEKETMEECLVELVNIWISAITILIALIIVLKYKYSKEQKECRRLLPFHTTRTLLCMTILVVLFLELCESFLTWISCSSIITIVAILYCWILHRNTEVKDGFGVAYTTGIFAAIGLSRAWKFTYLYRYGLSILHVRYTTTAITAIFCCLFAILDSYTLYLIVS